MYAERGFNDKNQPRVIATALLEIEIANGNHNQPRDEVNDKAGNDWIVECQKWCGCTHRVSGRRRATPRFTSELRRGPSLRGAVLLGPPETAERTLLPDKSLTNLETYFQCGLKLRLRRPAPLAAHFAVLSAAIRRASSRD